MKDDYIDDLFDDLPEVKIVKNEDILVGEGDNVSIAEDVDTSGIQDKLDNLPESEARAAVADAANKKKKAKELIKGMNSGVEEYYTQGLEPEDRKEMFETVTKAGTPDAEDFEEGFIDAVKEDYLIATDKKVNRADEGFGRIEIDGKMVNRRMPETDKKLAEALLRQTLRFFAPSNISRELLIKERMLDLKKLLLDERTYALYRHKFIHEKYDNILDKLPKVIKEEQGIAYLREAFMAIHVLFKYGKGVETLDELTVAEIIIEQNDILPSTQMHGKPFTLDFFLELANEGVFKRIQRMVNEEILSNQLTSLVKYVSKLIEDIVTGETESDAKQLRDLTEMLSKIQSMSEALDKDSKVTNLSYVFNDTSSGINYAELAGLEEVNPDNTVPFDFYYYITCYDLDIDKNEIFMGWLDYNQAKRKYESSFNSVKIWEIKNGDKKTEKEVIDILNDARKNGKHAKYVVSKMYNKEHKLKQEV